MAIIQQVYLELISYKINSTDKKTWIIWFLQILNQSDKSDISHQLLEKHVVLLQDFVS